MEASEFLTKTIEESFNFVYAGERVDGNGAAANVSHRGEACDKGEGVRRSLTQPFIHTCNSEIDDCCRRSVQQRRRSRRRRSRTL